MTSGEARVNKQLLHSLQSGMKATAENICWLVRSLTVFYMYFNKVIVSTIKGSASHDQCGLSKAETSSACEVNRHLPGLGLDTEQEKADRKKKNRHFLQEISPCTDIVTGKFDLICLS